MQLNTDTCGRVVNAAMTILQWLVRVRNASMHCLEGNQRRVAIGV